MAKRRERARMPLECCVCIERGCGDGGREQTTGRAIGEGKGG